MADATTHSMQISAILYKLACEEELTVGEQSLLLDWQAVSDFNQQIVQRIKDDKQLTQSIKDVYSVDKDEAWEELISRRSINKPAAVHRIHFLKTAWFRYAAAFILLAGTGAYLWFQSNRPQTLITDHKHLAPDILPGKEGAILTLADGRQVVLDSLGNGPVANQNGAQVVLMNGQLAYDPKAGNADELTYNTMTTPKGRQFQVVLPDGTKVWLNAASSLKFPTAFTGTMRAVELSGEAYFEVTTDKTKPFIVVAANKAQVQVLGTSFNISAYTNEASINTSLITGSLRVSTEITKEGGQGMKAAELVILKPGQQAQLTATADPKTQQRQMVVKDADMDKVMAWKNGLFNFEGADLPTVMRQLERWYDIDVVYEGKVTERKFKGKLERNLTLSQIMQALEYMNVKFRLEGRRLVVYP